MRSSPNSWHLLTISTLRELQIVFGIAVGAALWMQLQISLMLLRIYFISSAVTAALGILNLIAATLRFHDSIFIATGFTPMLEYVGVMLLWFAYFRKSVRVRNTYGANL
ncbi:MAG TPA: hypothetical protein VGJ30_10145 [Candidatus Angelobacter sp.]